MPNDDPEKWEATDHIENLKRDYAADEVRCASCDDLRRAVIWIIRHMERQDKKPDPPVNGPWDLVTGFCRTSPLAGSLAFGFYVFGKWQGVL